MKKNQYNIRLQKDIAEKWKEQALRLNLSDSKYIEILFKKIFEDGTLLYDKTELFGYEKMIEKNEEEKIRLRFLDKAEKEVIDYIHKSILYTNTEWNSPMLNLKIRYCIEFINNQIDEIKKFNGDRLMIENLEKIKENLQEKDEDKFYEKILDEKIIKRVVYHLAKRFNKDYSKILDYLKGKRKNLTEIKISGKLEEEQI